MDRPVPVVAKELESYRSIIGDRRVEEIRSLAGSLQGARVLHVNSTAFGGGVAELLHALVPLMSDVGLRAEWRVMHGADEFFQVTKAMHNSLQGLPVEWTPSKLEVWKRYNQLAAGMLEGEYDFVVVHDPQPAGLLSYLEDRLGRRPPGRWIWRCHIDTTSAQQDLWEFLLPYLERYDAAIFTMREYVKPGLAIPEIAIIPPAIDPLSPKNCDMPHEAAAEVLQRYGIDHSRPIISQVSRFDPWKDPLGVIDAYRLVKRQVPDVQLVMVASMAADDPEGWSYFERTARRAGEDPDIYLLTNLNGVGNLEVNAIQRESRVVLQKSIREGFGLVVSEALWKCRPVVGGKAGGIPLQVLDGKTGFLVTSVEEAADRVVVLLRDPELADRMGRAGHEHVRENFLITRYLRDYLALFRRLAETEVQQLTTGARTLNPVRMPGPPGA